MDRASVSLSHNQEVPGLNIEIPLKNSKSVICSKMAHDHISKKFYSKSIIFKCPDSAKFRLGHATSTSLLIKKRGAAAPCIMIFNT